MALLTGASERAGLTKVGTQKRLCALLQKYELPVSDPTDLQTIVNGALTDKKKQRRLYFHRPFKRNWQKLYKKDEKRESICFL